MSSFRKITLSGIASDYLHVSLADLITVSLYAVIPLPRLLTHVQYSAWILLAVETAACFGVITLVINLLLYKTQLNQAFDLLRKRTSKS